MLRHRFFMAAFKCKSLHPSFCNNVSKKMGYSLQVMSSRSLCSKKNVDELANVSGVDLFAPQEVSIEHLPAGKFNFVSTPADDEIISQLKMSTSIYDVLDIIATRSNLIDHNNIAAVFQCIFAHQKTKSARSMPNRELLRRPELHKLGALLKTHIRLEDPDNLVNTLKVLNYIGVPSSSVISQIVLQMLSKAINEISLFNVTFLHYLLSRSDPCPLVDALKIACPIVFNAHASTKLLSNNVSHLVTYLSYAARNNVSDENIDSIVNQLIFFAEMIRPQLAKQIALTLCLPKISSKFYGDRVKLYDACLDIVATDLRTNERADMKDIDLLLDRTIIEMMNNDLYYNEKFIESVINQVVTRNDDVFFTFRVLRALNRIIYVNYDFLDYVDSYFYNNQAEIQQMTIGAIISTVNAYANADYRPKNFDSYSHLFLKRFETEQARFELPWLRLCSDFMVLDCWPVWLIRKVFDKSFLSSFLNRAKNLLDQLNLLSIYQAVMTVWPNVEAIDESSLPIDILQKTISLNQHNLSDFPLLDCLKDAFGGPQFVLSGVLSHLGHFIDHVVYLDDENNPVKINESCANDGEVNSRINLKNLKIGPPSKIYCFLVIPPTSYAVNIEQMRGSARLSVQTLEALGYNVAPVSILVWNRLLEHERIPYLLRNMPENLALKSRRAARIL